MSSEESTSAASPPNHEWWHRRAMCLTCGAHVKHEHGDLSEVEKDECDRCGEPVKNVGRPASRNSTIRGWTIVWMRYRPPQYSEVKWYDPRTWEPEVIQPGEWVLASGEHWPEGDDLAPEAPSAALR